MTTTPRSEVSQRTQWGLETTPGSGGNASLKPATASMGLGPAGDGATLNRPGGGKYVTEAIAKDGWSEGDVKDVGDFNSLPYYGALNIAYAAPVATTTPGGYIYTHTPNPDAPETVKTLVVQEGVAGAVETYRNVSMPDFGLAITRNEIAVSGKSIGKKVAFGTSLTSATRQAKAPMSPLKGGWWTATNFAGTDMRQVSPPATRLDPWGFDAKWGNNGRFAPFFPTDDSIVSFAGLVEGEVDAPFTIMTAFDVASGDIAGPLNMAAYDNNTPIYLAYYNVGPLIVTGVHYDMLLQMCLQIVAPPKKTTVGKLKVYEFTCQCVVDDTAGVPFILSETTTLASL